jgi:hypothetical protein
MRSLPFLAIVLTSGALSAQAFTETFPFPNGTLIPGWTTQNGAFAITNQRLVPTGGRIAQYITTDRFSAIADCVQDVDVYYPTVVSLHYGGVCARHVGGPGEPGLVMQKLQDNSSTGTGAFNSSWLYERPGGAQAITGAQITPTVAGRVRMIIKGNQSWQQVDTNMDGIFEVQGVARTLIAPTTPAAGLVGITGYNAAEMDNYKFYDGVLMQNPAGGPPTIGTSYSMTFSAPLVNASPTPWRWALSFGKAGVPLGDGRALPLSLDPLFNVTLGIGVGGVLQSGSPEGTFAIPLPNDPSLIGVTVFAGAFTLDASRWLSVGAISNDHAFTIQ